MTLNEEFRLGLLLIKGLSVDELNELTKLLKIEREEYHTKQLNLLQSCPKFSKKEKTLLSFLVAKNTEQIEEWKTDYRKLIAKINNC